MALKNRSMYAILGILNIAPGTGYDIKKYSDSVLSGFWNENFGHIYPTLKKMSDDGMIKTVSGENSERKIRYEITAKGKSELEAWLKEKTEQQPVRSEFMLKFLFSNGSPREDVENMLLDYKDAHQKKLQSYNTIQSELKKGISGISNERAYFINSVLKSGILSCEAMTRWCDETIAGLDENNLFDA